MKGVKLTSNGASPVPTQIQEPIPKLQAPPKPAEMAPLSFRPAAKSKRRSRSLIAGFFRPAVAAVLIGATALVMIPTPEALPLSDSPKTEIQTGAALRSQARVDALIQRVIARSYPELLGVAISTAAFDSPKNYFQSRATIKSVLTPGAPHYVIDVNPLVFSEELPESAAEAIIAHELAHTLFYVSNGRLKMIGAIRAEFSEDFRVPFERSTDMEAILRGYGQGLIAYRQWIYAKLEPDELAEKLQSYLQPDEIQAVMDGLENYPQLSVGWRAHPPATLDAILKDVAQAANGDR